MASPHYNMRNPAVKRIMQEIKEMQAETTTDFIAHALEDDIFEWHFVVKGPRDTEFEGGIYHGRILLPAEYPFKPPSFMMLTPNGRFQTGVKICLSISSHHPEHWQPSWSVRTALTALIAFMPTPGQGALGSVDFTKDERKQLAAKSHTEVPKFGSAARQIVINNLHQRMLKLQAQAAAGKAASASSGADSSVQVSATAAPQATAVADIADVAAGAKASSDQASQAAKSKADSSQEYNVAWQTLQQLGSNGLQQHSQAKPDAGTDSMDSQQWQDKYRGAAISSQPTVRSIALQAAPTAAAPAVEAQLYVPDMAITAAGAAAVVAGRQLHAARASVAGNSQIGELPSDRGLTFLIVVLSVAIAAVLLKKVMTAMGHYRIMV